MNVLHRRQHVGAFLETQPRLSKLSLRGLMSLPYRLCNPPPAIGKVRSCTLTPIFKVQLEDVLNRKHLPPLGLKDFEEWLIFIEQCPENLYFVLWLREYTAKYTQWATKVKGERERAAKRARKGDYRDAEDPVASGSVHDDKRDEEAGGGGARVTFRPSAAFSPSLALSFERARQTFFTPGAPYELFVSPDLLHPSFLVPSSLTAAPPNGSGTASTSTSASPGSAFPSPHPDPALFAPLNAHLHSRLRASLTRCVRAATTNVGTFRATCGLVGGACILLLLSLPPLLVNFLQHNHHHGGSRWERVAALPGLWLGLTIIIASLRGVCMMVYVFGDFRQLRKFELERPPLPPVDAAASAAAAATAKKVKGAEASDNRSTKSSTALSFASSSSSTRTRSNSVYSSSSASLPPDYLPAKPATAHIHYPIKALTAPPRISVRIPGGMNSRRGSTASFATSSSSTSRSRSRSRSRGSGRSAYSRAGAGAGVVASEELYGTTEADGISIGSRHTFASSELEVGEPRARRHHQLLYGEQDADVSVSEGGEAGEADLGSEYESESDSATSSSSSSSSDHGIYISPLHEAPDELASLDAQGVQAALAMATRLANEEALAKKNLNVAQASSIPGVESVSGARSESANATTGNGNGGSRPSLSLALPPPAVFVSSPPVLTSSNNNNAPSPSSAPLTMWTPPPQQQQQQQARPATAAFIPAFPYAQWEAKGCSVGLGFGVGLGPGSIWEECDTWECDSPTSTAASASATAKRRSSSSRCSSLKSKKGDEKGKKMEKGEGAEEREGETGKGGPCWSIKSGRSRRSVRSTSISGLAAAGNDEKGATGATASADVDLEKGVVDTSAAQDREQEQLRLRVEKGKERRRRAGRRRRDTTTTTTTVGGQRCAHQLPLPLAPFDFDALPPAPPRQRDVPASSYECDANANPPGGASEMQQQQIRRGRAERCPVKAAAAAATAAAARRKRRAAAAGGGATTTTITDMTSAGASAGASGDGPLDRLWAFFCPLVATKQRQGLFSEKLFASSQQREMQQQQEKHHQRHPESPTSEQLWDNAGAAPLSPLSPTSPTSPSAGSHRVLDIKHNVHVHDGDADAEREREREWQTRWAVAQRTPAFGPVTRVLSPVVSRAQWEVVVRAFVLAGVLSWVVVGALVAVPVGA